LNAEGIKNLNQASLEGSVSIFQRALRAALLSLVLLVFGFAIAAKRGLRRLLEVIALPQRAYGIPIGLPFLAVLGQVVLEWRAERNRAALRALAIKADAEQIGHFRVGPHLVPAPPSVA
jgi:hypothetical protein